MVTAHTTSRMRQDLEGILEQLSPLILEAERMIHEDHVLYGTVYGKLCHIHLAVSETVRLLKPKESRADEAV